MYPVLNVHWQCLQRGFVHTPVSHGVWPDTYWAVCFDFVFSWWVKSVFSMTAEPFAVEAIQLSFKEDTV